MLAKLLHSAENDHSVLLDQSLVEQHTDENVEANEVKVEIEEPQRDINSGTPSQTDSTLHQPELDQQPVLLYRRLFRQKRQEQKEAVKKIVSLGSYEKQYKMIKMLFSKLFPVMTRSRARLSEFNFAPGDPFPTADEVKDALSTILENTVFVGDILLRLPDITHDLLKVNQDWSISLHWGIGFCNDTAILTGPDTLLLHTMAQELNLIERDLDYVNPYKAETIQTKQAEEQRSRIAAEVLHKTQKGQPRKDKNKNNKRGPRMTSPRHSEL